MGDTQHTGTALRGGAYAVEGGVTHGPEDAIRERLPWGTASRSAGPYSGSPPTPLPLTRTTVGLPGALLAIAMVAWAFPRVRGLKDTATVFFSPPASTPSNAAHRKGPGGEAGSETSRLAFAALSIVRICVFRSPIETGPKLMVAGFAFSCGVTSSSTCGPLQVSSVR